MKKLLLSFAALALVASGSVFAIGLQQKIPQLQTIKQLFKLHGLGGSLILGGGLTLLYDKTQKLFMEDVKEEKVEDVKKEKAQEKTLLETTKKVIAKNKGLIAKGSLAIGTGLEIYAFLPQIKSLCPDFNNILPSSKAPKEIKYKKKTRLKGKNQ